MPSYVIHLSCAKRILELHPVMNEREENLFYLGNMVADMCIDKRKTHFWDAETYCKLVRKPNLQMFLDEYGKFMQEPYVRGYYTHLLLDTAFLESYWKNHFRFYDKNRCTEILYDMVAYVEVIEQQTIYDRTEFFSSKWYYGDYDRLNGYFAKKYEPKFPDISFDEEEKMRVKKIQEIDWDYAIGRIAKTENMLQESIHSCNQTESPELRIFCLAELEELVETVAKKVADM